MIHREEERTKWCPRCGAEYRDDITECADCHVPLTRDPPPPAGGEDRDDRHGRATDTDEHDAVAYDLHGWNDDQRSLLQFILNGDDIPYILDDDLLVTPHVHQAKVEDILDSIEGEPIDDEPIDDAAIHDEG